MQHFCFHFLIQVVFRRVTNTSRIFIRYWLSQNQIMFPCGKLMSTWGAGFFSGTFPRAGWSHFPVGSNHRTHWFSVYPLSLQLNMEHRDEQTNLPAWLTGFLVREIQSTTLAEDVLRIFLRHNCFINRPISYLEVKIIKIVNLKIIWCYSTNF